MSASFLIWLQHIARFILRLIARIEVVDFDKIPRQGGLIVVSNHNGLLDAMLGVIFSPREDIIMLVAKKYRAFWLWRWVGNKLDAVWLDRQQTDFHAMREARRRLQEGGLAAMAPEGTRSPTGALQPGKAGAVFLAAKADVPILPIAITGTRDREVKQQLRRLRRLRITLRAGDPFALPPLERKERDAYLEQWTTETMCRLAALLPPSYRGVYAGHPRVAALLNAEQVKEIV